MRGTTSHMRAAFPFLTPLNSASGLSDSRRPDSGRCSAQLPDHDLASRLSPTSDGTPMTNPIKQQLTFAPPGPGSWELDPVHFPRPVTAYWMEMHPDAFSLGYADLAAYYGLPFQ